MQNSNKPDLIVFDLDNTLYKYDEANAHAEEKLLNFLSLEISTDKDVLTSTFKFARQKVKDRLGDTGSSHSRILYLNEMFRILELNPRPSFLLKAEQVFWSSYFQKMSPRPGLLDFMSFVRHLRIPLMLVSDLTLQIQLKKLIGLGLDNTFDVIFVSEELGGDKKTGVPLMNLQENYLTDINIWFVGDQPSDYIRIAENNKFFIFTDSANDATVNQFSITDFFALEKILKKCTE